MRQENAPRLRFSANAHLPAMQAFHCDRCDKTLIWKGASPSALSMKRQSVSRVETEGSGWICRYVAISFHRAKDRFSPGEAIECPDARLAVKRAELMMRNSKTVGAVAFSRRSNLQTGTVEAAEILRIPGMIPDGFDIA
jgi:hypothetical protein